MPNEQPGKGLELLLPDTLLLKNVMCFLLLFCFLFLYFLFFSFFVVCGCFWNSAVLSGFRVIL